MAIDKKLFAIVAGEHASGTRPEETDVNDRRQQAPIVGSVLSRWRPAKELLGRQHSIIPTGMIHFCCVIEWEIFIIYWMIFALPIPKSKIAIQIFKIEIWLLEAINL